MSKDKKKKREFLVTFYVKNADSSNQLFNIAPVKSSIMFGDEELIQEFCAAKMKANTFVRCCSIMEKDVTERNVFDGCGIIDNPYYKEDKDTRLVVDREDKQIDEEAYEDKKIKVKLDNEQKVIRLGPYFYDLKGVLISEATEEEKNKYMCGPYMTYPIVEDNWEVRDDDCIIDGIQYLEVGKKGDVVTLESISEAAEYNAQEQVSGYEDILMDLESHGITVSNRKKLDSSEELSDTIVLRIEKVLGDRYRIDSDEDSYYLPKRFFYIGDDDELYVDERDEYGRPGRNQHMLIKRIVDDIWGLSYFFNKPNLRVLVTAIEESGLGYAPDNLKTIPSDWYYTIQTLEKEINKALDEKHKENPDYYFREKRPDVFVDKK
jgi:hypothetical protein